MEPEVTVGVPPVAGAVVEPAVVVPPVVVSDTGGGISNRRPAIVTVSDDAPLNGPVDAPAPATGSPGPAPVVPA